jgi:ADP-ribose pyrophosphatase YjhB (NUDIX family)
MRLTSIEPWDDGTPWAPETVFESILQYAVIPTFDLIMDFPEGVLLVRRSIAPYKNCWALPGLRMLRGETVDACLERIAKSEVGCSIDPIQKIFVNQAVVSFPHHHGRQDVSTCYAFNLTDGRIALNPDHIDSSMIISHLAHAPSGLGRLYREHLERYFAGLDVGRQRQ